jgi:hypothetical protein
MARLFSVNNSPATCAEAIFNLKTLLKTAGWTVTKSSDGLTYNASGDQISHGGTGANGMFNSLAWFVIQMPGNTRAFCIQRHVSVVSYSHYWRIKYSKAAGFTGGSPGILQVPSATDEAVVVGSGTDESPSMIQLFNTGDGTFRHNFFVDNTAPYGFMSWGWTRTAGLAIHVFGLDPLLGTLVEDTDPYIIYVKGEDTDVLSQTSFVANGGQVAGWLGSTWFGRLAYPSACGLAPVWAPTANQVNLINNKDDLYPITILGARAANNLSYKGISTFVRAIGQPGRKAGDLYSVVTAKDGVVMGECMLPWDGSSVPLV